MPSFSGPADDDGNGTTAEEGCKIVKRGLWGLKALFPNDFAGEF